MATSFNEKFIEDNFFSDDDWDINDCSSGSWEISSSLQNTSMYLQHESEAGFSETEINNPVNGIESPPLTPPEGKVQSSSDSTLDDHVDATTCEELLACLEGKTLTDSRKLYHSKGASTSVNSRHLSGSDASSSSSTSAYSSQSTTPPPIPKAYQDRLNSAFFNEVLLDSDQKYSHNRDEGFHENTRIATSVSTNTYSRKPARADTGKIMLCKTRKLQVPKGVLPVSISCEEESDFDKQVREALQETNRLLNLHKVKSKELEQVNAETNSPQANDSRVGVDLRQLCDSTILHNDSQLPFKVTNVTSRALEKQHVAEHVTRDLKRKASKNLKILSKRLHLCATSSIACASVSTSIGVQPVQTQSIQVSSVKPFQAPLKCNNTNSQHPMNIIMKEEAMPSLFQTTSSLRYASAIIEPSRKTVVADSGSQSITSSTVMTHKHDEIPLNSILIKSDKKNTSIPISSLNITNCHAVKPSQQKLSAKPLMVSQPATTAIVPNGNSVFPSTLHQNRLGVETRQDSNDILFKNHSNSLDLEEINRETQNRVLKRQQRMMKNREAACQSRQRRKAYITMLEQQMNECVDSNNKLLAVNAKLQQRVAELEKENARLRAFANPSTTSQKKAACVLMLVFFIGLNAKSVNFLSNQRISNESPIITLNHSKTDAENWALPSGTGYHIRQLLSMEEREIQLEKLQLSNAEKKDIKDTSLMGNVRDDYIFWIDDIVKDYMKKHFNRVLELMHGTSSISLQRLLRRKLKEELGILFPLSVPNAKRISYSSARVTQEHHNYLGKSFSDQLVNTERKGDIKVPSSLPDVKVSREPPCHYSSRMTQLNETESIRISDNLAKWIKHHKVLHQNKKKTASNRLHDNPNRNSKRKRRSSSFYKQHVRSSVPALYEKRNEKMKRLLDAINRKNDTVYMISFNKDHILLPAVMLNTSGYTKMSLVLPTAPPNDTFANNQQQTMIQINCEVLSTDYLKMDRDVLSSSQYQSHTDGYSSDVWMPHKKNGNPKLHALHSPTYHHNKRKDGLVKTKNSRLESTDDVTMADNIDL